MSPAPIPPQSATFLLEEAAARDPALTRRLALLRILLDERYLDRQQLVMRLASSAGPSCFGSAWEDVFYRDMRVVKAALAAAGYRLRYSRDPKHSGYYLAGQPALSDELRKTIRQSVAEIDRVQIGVFQRMSPANRFRLGCSVTDTARDAVAYRLRQQNPQLSPIQASFQAVQGRPFSEENHGQ
ncbi:MAG: hypothetical protein EHM70_14210 [Chloroflexota bacterium]|nr:MAG: hypothetical protein EHM70_14210 [Chloroflexota bacterium]